MIDRASTRQLIWKELVKVAKPDSRFHLNFAERLYALDAYKNAEVVFVTPDNCLEDLRAQVIRDRKTLLVTTYGIRRGFVELTRADVPAGAEDLVVLLDAIEKYGRYVSLAEIRERYKIDLLVTGGSIL